MNPEFIPLGESCAIAYQLHKHGKRKQAYPFDWIRTGKLKNITNLINENFMCFTSFVKCSDKGKNNFPKVDGDNFNKDGKPCVLVKNKFNMRFPHDFDETNFKEQGILVRQKYFRRIDKFKDIINSEKKVIFIREESILKPWIKYQVNNFIKQIEKKNNNLDFKFVLVLHNPEKKELEFKDVHEKVIIFENNEPFEGWERDNFNWEQVFNYFI
jgi:hypothetical protein